MPLTPAERQRVLDLVVPTAPVWTPGMWKPPAGSRVIDRRGKSLVIQKGTRSGLDLGDAPVTLVGGHYRSWYGPGMSWRDTKRDDAETDILRWGERTGLIQVVGIDVDLWHDCLGPNKSPSGNPNVDLEVAHCRARRGWDDWLENDGGKLRVKQSHLLLDGVGMWISDRRSDDHGRTPTYTTEHCLIGLRNLNWDDRSTGTLKFLKGMGNPPRQIHKMRNTLLFRPAAGQLGSPDVWPTKDCTYENVWIIQEGGRYPGKLPPGITLIDDVELWHLAVERWQRQHDLSASDDAPAPEPKPQGFPIDLSGGRSYRVVVPVRGVPAREAEQTVALITAEDPDWHAEAVVRAPSGKELVLYGDEGRAEHDKKVVEVVLPFPETPDGDRIELEFAHTATAGSRIDAFALERRAKAPGGDPDAGEGPGDPDGPPDPGEEPDDGDGPVDPAEELAHLRAENAELKAELTEARATVQGLREVVEATADALEALAGSLREGAGE